MQEKEIKNYFLEQVNVLYRRIIQEAASTRTERQLKQLWMQYTSVKAQDYLKSPLATEAKAACERRALEFRKEEE
jgi:hypothetical protein